MSELSDWDVLVLTLANQTPKISQVYHKLKDAGLDSKYKRSFYLYLKIYRSIKRLERLHLLRDHRGYLKISPKGRELLNIQKRYNSAMNSILGDVNE